VIHNSSADIVITSVQCTPGTRLTHDLQLPRASTSAAATGTYRWHLWWVCRL